MAATHSPALESILGRSLFPFKTLREVNERCIESLVQAARGERESFPLSSPLRPLIRSANPSTRRRAAQWAFLLVDMEFRNLEWWQRARARPQKRWRATESDDAFPRRLALPLARATLVFAWQALQAQTQTACILLGMAPAVAQIIRDLPLSELDVIADRSFRDVRPRWQDQPAVWQDLFVASESNSPSLMRQFNLHALQLLVGPWVLRKRA